LAPNGTAHIHAAVFDNDGLFVDTQTLWKRAQARLFAENSVQFGPPEEQTLLGLSRQDLGAALADYFRQPAASGDQLYERLEALAFEELDGGCELMPGALALAERIRAAALPLGLTSNSSRSFVEATLDVVDARRIFDVVVTVEDVTSPKPAPDLYLVACSQLGVLPRHSVAFEDSPTGMDAAAAAGLWVIAVPSAAANAVEAADLIVPTLESLEIERFFADRGVALR
jgi:HAD superfamily hydrolase (TIGR01509 family)